MRFTLTILTVALLSGCAVLERPEPLRIQKQALRAPPYQTISLAGFEDNIKHWRNRYGSNYAKYDEKQIVEIADNLLLYQRDNGSWVENRDPTRILNTEEKAKIVSEKANPTGSFDNRNLYTQVEYLAGVYGETGDVRYHNASMKGLEYIFAKQHQSCGGWPHTVPGTEPYHPYITMADEVTSGVLSTLRKVASATPPFSFVSWQTRWRAERAVERGDACILQLQLIQNGQRTGWAGQYDPVTLAPMMGRKFELASIVSQESVANLRYLMRIENPSPEVIAAIEAGVAWLERSKIHGKRVETFKIEPIKYEYHTASTDRRIVDDPAAPPLWARFHDLNDNSPVLANRDSTRVYRYEDIAHERRTGYAWFGTWPARLLAEDYPAWKKRLAR